MPRHTVLEPKALQALDQMKYEIAQEFDITLGPDTIARANGYVGGIMTQRLVAYGEQIIQKQAQH